MVGPSTLDATVSATDVGAIIPDSERIQMSKWFKFASVTAAAITLASPAMAQVTATEVWNNWQSVMKGFGMETSVGNASESGGTLTVTNFTASLRLTDGGMTQTIPQIVFANQADGTVAITMSPSYPIIISGKSPKGRLQEVKLRVQSRDLKTIASGSALRTQYDYTAASLEIVVDEMVKGGKIAPIMLEMAFDDLTGTYVASGQQTTSVTQTMNAASLTTKMSLKEPKAGKSVKFAGVMRDIKSSGSGIMPAIGFAGDLAAALNEGAKTTASLTHGRASYTAAFDDNGQQGSFAGKAATGALNLSISADGLGYRASTEDLEMTVASPDMPFPEIRVTFAKMGFDLEIPVTKSDVSRDFRLAINVTDATVSDPIWSMFDPSAKLPRDPATLAFDLSGKVDLFADLFDPALVDAKDTTSVGQLRALSLNSLMVSAIGAVLTASGSFTFDNSDKKAFNGMPAPTGAVDMTLVGANGLIDKLVALGFVKDQQAMGARMMLGLFARPTGGNDTLTSKIEVQSDGAILANGQRLR